MQTVTEILIDFSSSMSEKLSLTKSSILNDIIPNLDYSAKIGIKTFSATNEKVPIINVILPLSITNKEQIITSINSLAEPNGNTPIAVAINDSVNSLKEYLAFDKKIILITDGEENCDGNYKLEVEKAKIEGINCQIHIIGIGLSQEAMKQAISISTLSKGSFSHIQFVKGTIYNQHSVKQNLTPFYSAVKQNTYQQAKEEAVIVQENKPISTSISQINTLTSPTIETIKPIITPPINSEIVQKIQSELDRPISIEIQKEGKINSTNNDALTLIINEIQEIKNQLKDLKQDKNVIPDFVENHELNEKIGKASEEYLFEILKKKYPDRVKWLNENGESGIDHDFEIFELDGSIEYYIECKGTSKNKSVFCLTKNEWRLFLNHTKNYQLYFIKNSFSIPTHIFVDNLLDWLLKGKVVPYLKERQVIKENRVFLTLLEL